MIYFYELDVYKLNSFWMIKPSWTISFEEGTIAIFYTSQMEIEERFALCRWLVAKGEKLTKIGYNRIFAKSISIVKFISFLTLIFSVSFVSLWSSKFGPNSTLIQNWTASPFLDQKFIFYWTFRLKNWRDI